MAQAQRYKLKLSKLQFCSLVDEPAQPNAKTLLIKRAGKQDEIVATAKFVKSSDDLGLAFFWAFTTTNTDGSAHYDLQGDNIGEDFIKAAMEFMTAEGGAVDEMHDGVPTGARVVFAMPMTPDIAKAYGLITKQSGLMIAIKPTADQLAKLKDGTYTGVSIAGLGERLPVDKKRKVAKQVILTDLVDGHQHGIDLDDPADWCGDRLSTTWATSEGAEQQHCHVWTFDGQTGAVTIAADSGHTHDVYGVVPASVLAVFALNEQAEAKETATDVLERVLDGEMAGAGVSVTVAARAPRSNSTPGTPIRTVKAHPEKPMPNEQDAKIADLTAKTTELSKRNGALSRMSAVAFAVFKSLSTADADAFLEKTVAEQDAAAADIAKRNDEADKVVYLSKSTGDVFKAKDDPRLVEMAKRLDAEAEKVEKADIRKAAAELLGGMPGDDATHDLIVSALRKSGAKAEAIEEAFKTLKGMKATSTIGKRAPGITGDGKITGGTPNDALAALEAGLVEFGKSQNITKGLWTDGMAAFTQTEKGAALKRAYDESLLS